MLSGLVYFRVYFYSMEVCSGHLIDDMGQVVRARCHQGLCPPCGETSKESCYCGKTQAVGGGDGASITNMNHQLSTIITHH